MRFGSSAYRAGASASIAVLATGLLAATAQAQPLVAGAHDVDYVSTGAPQVFTVPAGVTTLQVTLWGGQAAGYDGDTRPVRGWGGSVSGRLRVTPGERITVYVGGSGGSGAKYDGRSSNGGYGGGGAGHYCDVGGTPGWSSGGGGGGTDIRVGGTAPANRVAVAGGAGGAGRNLSVRNVSVLGGAGGAGIGASGTGPYAGRGGTQGAGGLPGTGGTAGRLGVGGAGAGCSGGGGGGYYGGGSGGGATTAQASGGGGGSNFTGSLSGASSVQGDSSLASDPGYQALVSPYGTPSGFARISYVQS